MGPVLQEFQIFQPLFYNCWQLLLDFSGAYEKKQLLQAA